MVARTYPRIGAEFGASSGAKENRVTGDYQVRMTTTPSFDEIVSQYGPMIGRIASGYETDVHLAEDLVQDILIALWRALPSFRGDASLKTFVARLATNRAVSHVRGRLRLRTAELSEDHSSPL